MGRFWDDAAQEAGPTIAATRVPGSTWEASCRPTAPGPRLQRRAVRPRVDQLDDRGAAVQLAGDAPTKPLVQMSPVDQPHTGAGTDVAQPSLLAGPGSTSDEPKVVDSEGGESLIDQTVRHHVLPHGRRRTDPGTPAHQAGLGPLEDGDVVSGPMQQRRCHAAGDRSPDNADSHAYRPPDPSECHPGR